MERETGLEPATSSLGSWHSTTELLPRSVPSPRPTLAVRLLRSARTHRRTKQQKRTLPSGTGRRTPCRSTRLQTPSPYHNEPRLGIPASGCGEHGFVDHGSRISRTHHALRGRCARPAGQVRSRSQRSRTAAPSSASAGEQRPSMRSHGLAQPGAGYTADLSRCPSFGCGTL